MTRLRSLPNQRDSTPELGLILAAGLGSRLDSLKTKSRLKPLFEFQGEPLILRVVRGMERVGCRRVVVVVGFFGHELRTELGRLYKGPMELEFVDNPDYEKSNGLSVLAAQKRLDVPFILSMSDHLISEAIWELAKQHSPPAGGATLLVDRKIGSVFDLDDATKVVTEGSRLVDIGKHLTTYDAVDTGVFVATSGLVNAISEEANSRGDASLSQGVARLAAKGLMEVLDVGQSFWADIDTPEMLNAAEGVLARK